MIRVALENRSNEIRLSKPILSRWKCTHKRKFTKSAIGQCDECADWYLQCQQCDSKYHTLLWTRFNHFLDSRKITKRTQNVQTRKRNFDFFTLIDQIEFYWIIFSCLPRQKRTRYPSFINFDSRVTHNLAIDVCDVVVYSCCWPDVSKQRQHINRRFETEKKKKNDFLQCSGSLIFIRI